MESYQLMRIVTITDGTRIQLGMIVGVSALGLASLALLLLLRAVDRYAYT
jgi:hypothetical protein